MTVVDSHVHLWDPRDRDYPWMVGESLEPLRRRFGIEHLLPVASKSVEQVVLVQATSSVEETRWLLSVAQSTPLVAGVVGWVDMRSPTVGDCIGELRASGGGNKLVGLRHQVEDEREVDWFASGTVRDAFSVLAVHGLAFDLLVRPDQLTAAVSVLADTPDVTFVLDHAAKPRIQDPPTREWEEAVRRLARLPNAYCKVSGLVTEADWDSWTQQEVLRYVDRIVNRFGPERLMVGSDWPVCTLAGTYQEVLDSYLTAVEVCLGRIGSAGVFAANAQRAYALPETADGHDELKPSTIRGKQDE